MFEFLKKKTNNMSCESETDKNKVAIDRFQRYLNLVNKNRFGYAPVQCAKILIKIIVEYLNYEEALQSFEKEHGIQNNTLIEEIYLKIESYLFLNKKTSYMEESMKVDINKLPILLNPWSEERILNNFVVINDNNVFDGVRFSSNINNHYLYPMNIVVCNGANHSQLSARYQNKGETIITKIKDFTSLYDNVKFDGVNYIKVKDNSIIEIEYDENILFYSGVIFELGRYLIGDNYLNSDLLGGNLNL
jgi:hypothetical protein